MSDTATYLIPDCNLAELEARIAKLNKRAVRLGVPEIIITKAPDHVRHQVRQLQSGCEIGGPMTRLVWRHEKDMVKLPPEQLPTGAYLANAWEPTGVVMTWWKVEVTGSTPSYNGWQFIATLEPLSLEDGAVENLIQCVPGHVCPEAYRKDVGRCDHCKAIRKRNQTFVLRHEDGSDKVVGRQCLKDFLGYNGDPHQMASWAESMAELGSLCGSAEDDEWLGGGEGGGRDRAWDLKHFLTLTACRVRLFGWLGRGKARDEGGYRTPTADEVLRLLTPPHHTAGKEEKQGWEKFRDQHVETEADPQTAEAAIEWAKSIPSSEREGENNYLANVNLVARCGTASRKTAGVAASIIVAYQKATEKEIQRLQLASRPESNWVGEEGKRIQLITVKCERVIRNEGAYGLTGIHKMTDEVGNDLTWFASSSATWLKEGEMAHISASIKSHGEYKGRKQTVLTRVTIWTEEGVAEHRAKEEKKAARAAKKAAKENSASVV